MSSFVGTALIPRGLSFGGSPETSRGTGSSVLVRSEQRPGWAVVWKQDGTGRVRDCLLSFGLSDTAEQAAERVRMALKNGTGNPPRSVARFREQFEGGVFYPVAVHLGVAVPRVRR